MGKANVYRIEGEESGKQIKKEEPEAKRSCRGVGGYSVAEALARGL